MCLKSCINTSITPSVTYIENSYACLFETFLNWLIHVKLLNPGGVKKRSWKSGSYKPLHSQIYDEEGG